MSGPSIPRSAFLGRALRALLPACALVVACGKEPAGSRPVTVFAAASTKDALEEIAEIFRREQGIVIAVSPGASNTLATQIIEGAPADLFLSASVEWADSLKAKGHALETRNLLGNSLVIAVPAGNPAGVKSPADLRSEAVKKVALAGENVPAGKYAQQALRSAGLDDELARAGKIVRGEDVRMALAFVERGAVEAGILYETDVKVSRDVEKAFRFDPGTHDPIVYPLVLLRAAEKSENARKFHAFLQMAEARTIFARHGFTAPD